MTIKINIPDYPEYCSLPSAIWGVDVSYQDWLKDAIISSAMKTIKYFEKNIKPYYDNE